MKTLTDLKNELLSLQFDWNDSDCHDECMELEDKMADVEYRIAALESDLIHESFERDRFDYHGGYLHYRREDGTRVFIARFKYAALSSKGPWITALIKNWSVQEYLDLAERTSPLAAMESKGFILSHIKRWLKDGGYPVTQEGYKALLADQTAKFA